jgi:exonuclease I
MANPSFDPRMMAVIRKDFEEKVLTDEQIMLYTRKANDYMSLLRSRAALIGQIKANERSRKNLRNKTTSRSAVASRSVNSSVAMARKAGVSESRIMHNSDELRRWLGGGR